MQYVIGCLVCPLRAVDATYGQVQALASCNQANRDSDLPKKVYSPQIATLVSLSGLVTQSLPRSLSPVRLLPSHRFGS